MPSLYPLLFSIRSTGWSISLLATHGFLNESFMLARAFLERLVSYIYLLSCDEDEYGRYLAHTKQKGFRMLNRSIEAGKFRAELKSLGSVDLSKDQELKEAIDLFTSKGGRQVTRWTKAGLPTMLTVIDEKGGLKSPQMGYLMLALLGIYEQASEALHGTLYGSIFHVGAFTKKLPSTKRELTETFNENFSMLFQSLGVCIDSLVRAIDTLVPIDELCKRSTDNTHSISSGKWLPRPET
ncbi:MAG: DUF5677 domain-containing protein [Dehalococcoidia bacterium]